MSSVAIVEVLRYANKCPFIIIFIIFVNFFIHEGNTSLNIPLNNISAIGNYDYSNFRERKKIFDFFIST
jgi:hypothetical protein